ncbi:MAG: hypothetical protein A3G33_01835 [Omnitrophica bacterium RIFCSPLOWO2_12_FULL_44_17]|uniref:diguanylate cyclase n=1 Tax=Candidatus Danuiimicrobium aquiferis TaxID=1801832 RepID=A0A1G1KVD3_9BACT|nr:MAG: hypothetical protein A3B72_01065 [Omnitrophica bacterium RIFCSPHIGHO2_02_FULL_45_28]OGW91735.1 MAG: hypothetical protein A3E74_06785 [Omnitrophica bacterium RIFCSPHIGHO2_12_FULL_44_12]OGW96851.1 MAG: hypothetical protein A3G33_01835 [Omnitrophica bacterium RIFCSPLOWO2_12_FULL_44_17]OGX02758.1 MAG: hypothetical protein A3J12_11770 [Omnitrophica bacterium RIFCSPLOWO2_02_FULL_44_11]
MLLSRKRKIDHQAIKTVVISRDERLLQWMRKIAAEHDQVFIDFEYISNFDFGLELITTKKMDLVLFDLSSFEANKMDLMMKILDQAENVPVIVLAQINDEACALEAIEKGAQDYLTKELLDPNQVFRAIRCAVLRHDMIRELRVLSMTDELTGVQNRRGFHHLAEQQMKLAIRAKRGLVLIFADVDRMKWINDAYGHQAGDMALAEATEVLRKTFRGSDIIGRIGGDEFAVLAIEAHKENVPILMSRLKYTLEEHNRQKKHNYELSLSIGAAWYDPTVSHVSFEDMMARADEAMYAHKLAKMQSYI